MHFLPILSTLRRHRSAAALIVLEIAVTCAIVCNAIFVIGDRLARMDRPTGVVEEELLHVHVAGIGQGADTAAVTEQDLAGLRAIPGVRSVAVSNMVPFGGSSWNTSVGRMRDDPHSINSAMYIGSEDLLETLGVRLVAGRDFTADEYVDMEAAQSSDTRVPSVILTRGLAERLFPGQDPLGKLVHAAGKEPQTVVGVIEHLARPNDFQGAAGARFAIVLPIELSYATGGTYVLRVDPARRAEVLGAVAAVIDRVDQRRVLMKRETLTELRAAYYEEDRAMAYLLVGVSIALLVITALGVVGLASFWVQQRTRQIGIRRALGATRGDILRYFQLENFILATLGIVLGMGLAYGINLWLMDKYQVSRLPAELLPVGALLLWLLGQIAVLGPALRASMIPPAIATRTV